MANELNLPLAPAQTGLTVTAILIQGNAVVGSPISCPESGTVAGHYSGDMPAVAAGLYGIRFLSGGSQVGTGVIDWDGTKERGLGDLPTTAAIWGYSGRTLDGTQAAAITSILEDTATTIPGLIAALPTLAQVQAAGFTTTRNDALISMEAYTRPMAKQLGLVSGISTTHSRTAIVVSDGDGSTTITDNGGGSYTVALT
jgi:hypothetical protein